jgi:hypothetical protein
MMLQLLFGAVIQMIQPVNVSTVLTAVRERAVTPIAVN